LHIFGRVKKIELEWGCIYKDASRVIQVIIKMPKLVQVSLNVAPSNIVEIQIENGRKRKCQIEIKTIANAPKKPRYN
jgi:hypothetical protein